METKAPRALLSVPEVLKSANLWPSESQIPLLLNDTETAPVGRRVSMLEAKENEPFPHDFISLFAIVADGIKDFVDFSREFYRNVWQCYL